jgi:hypothetical protein
VGVRADEQDVFELQPGIIVNNRNKLPGDFSTSKQRIVAETGGPGVGEWHDAER